MARSSRARSPKRAIRPCEQREEPAAVERQVLVLEVDEPGPARHGRLDFGQDVVDRPQAVRQPGGSADRAVGAAQGAPPPCHHDRAAAAHAAVEAPVDELQVGDGELLGCAQDGGRAHVAAAVAAEGDARDVVEFAARAQAFGQERQRLLALAAQHEIHVRRFQNAFGQRGRVVAAHHDAAARVKALDRGRRGEGLGGVRGEERGDAHEPGPGVPRRPAEVLEAAAEVPEAVEERERGGVRPAVEFVAGRRARAAAAWGASGGLRARPRARP